MKDRLRNRIQKVCKGYLVEDVQQCPKELQRIVSNGVSPSIFAVEFYKSLAKYELAEKIRLTFSVLSELKAQFSNSSVSGYLIKALLYIFNEFKLPQDEISSIAYQNWACIEPETLYKYCNTFKVHIEKQDVFEYASYLLISNNVEKAATLLKDFKYLVMDI